MAITIEDWSSYSPGDYAVTVNNHRIKTTVTADSTTIDRWISEINRTYQTYSGGLIVGLDVEWRPNFSSYRNPVATLQLCVGDHCLIYQIIHNPNVPQSLRYFLRNSNSSFVGVGIEEDVQKLMADYNLEVPHRVDLRNLAASKMGVSRNAGLKELALEVLGWRVEKPKRVTLGIWDAGRLSKEQIQYACVDAFLSSEIGNRLLNTY
ncbi:hypothetical protein Dimus_002075 [Dionaea muscipula]